MRLLVSSLLLLLAALSPRDAVAVEDPCIGESASTPIAVCTDIEVSEWKISNSWSYDVGGWGPTVMECQGRGGTMGNDSLGYLVCSGAADWVESNFVSMSRAIADERYVLTGNLVDDGWKSSEGSQNCDPDVHLGFVRRECRKLEIEFLYENGTTDMTTFSGLRTREVRCPNGYLPVATPNGTRCKIVICDIACQADSGARHPSLANVRREPVFGKPGSLLSFDRVWSSQGAFNPGDGHPGPGPAAGKMNRGWSHSLDKQLLPAGDRIGVLASIQEPDGTVIFYGLDGLAIQAVSGPREKLQAVSDGSPTKWRRTRQDDSVESFDAAGRLIAVATRGPERIDIDYVDGLIHSVTDQQGRSLHFLHDAAGNMVAAELPDGQELVFEYSLRGVLQSITRSDGAVRSFEYDDWLILNKVIDESGRQELFEYSSAGQLRRMASGAYRTTDSYGSPVTRWREDIKLTYSSTGKYTEETDKKSKVVRRTYADIGGVRKPTSTRVYCENHDCAPRTTVYTYDASGRMRTIKDPENRLTVLGYDTRGRVSSRHELATVVEGVVTSFGRRTETDWHASFNVPLERRLYDAGNVLIARSQWTYNAAGQVLTESRLDPSTGSARTIAYAYCDATDAAANNSTCPIVGLLKSVDGARTDVSDVTAYQYYAASADENACAAGGSCHRVGDLHKVINALGHETTYTRYDLAGRPLQLTDPNGVVIDLEYDSRGRMTARKIRGFNEASESDDAITRVEYDDAGLVEGITSPDGARIGFDYDAAGRLTRVYDALGNSVKYTLDGVGNRVREETRDPGDVLRRDLSRVYDKLSELKTVADAASNPSDFTYTQLGQLDTATDFLGRITDNDYDAFGRLSQSIANAAGVGADRPVTLFDYDVRDNLIKVTDPKGLDTHYGYDGLNDLVSLVSPDTGTSVYSYDSAGNRISKTDARNIQLLYAYDELNRLVAIQRENTGPGGPITLAEFSYDQVAPGSGCSYSGTIGRLTRFSSDAGTTYFCYDHRGNVERKLQAAVGGPDRALGYRHDVADQIQQVVYPSGLVVDYVRNTAGQVTGVSARVSEGETHVSLVTDVSYLPFGPMTSLTFGNGRVLTKSYDLNYGIDRVADNALGGMDVDYTLDLAGNVVGLSERSNDGAVVGREVSNDALGRLTELRDGSALVQGFTYDATGNRTSKTTTTTATYAYELASHRLTQVGTVGRTYDSAGNMLTRAGSGSFTYDYRGRMSAYIVTGGAGRQYGYDALGQRIAKTAANTANNVYYLFDEAGKLMGEYRSDGTTLREYIWVGDVLVALRGGYAGHKFQYVLTDHLNTPRAVVLPSSNTIIWRWDLTTSAFGDHMPLNNPDGDAYNFVFNLRYPGQYFDAETGLHYNYFRDYDPSTGRYVQSDPIGLAGGLSTYTYAASSAFIFSDPLGLAIYLQFHEVLSTGKYHGKLVVIPEDASRWKNHPLFVKHGFATFGGGPDGFPKDTMLHGDFNRPNDVRDGFVECIEAIPMRGLSEDEVIFNLIYGTNRYNEKKLPYGLAPEYTPGFYNSNSFVRGLGASSGLLLPSPRRIGVAAPGYSKPVPMEYFR